MTYQIIYSSQATAPMSLADLEEILADARTGNERRNVTGILVYVDGVFLQILEGEEETLRCLLRSIASDSRHTAMKVFHEAEIDGPTFKNWRMAYLSASPHQMAIWAGLEGTATIDSVLGDMHREPHLASRLAANLLRALAP
jgi:hypothetical protein